MNKSVERLGAAIQSADAVFVGAGAGLSTAAGYVYSGERFMRYFADFHRKYRFADMYSGGFYPYPTPEERWGFWSRNIYINRYMKPPKPVYDDLLRLVKDRDYFVITTNVDHCFQRAGFDKARLFYTQGDYGLWQCSGPCHSDTYDNAETVRRMVEAQGFVIADNGDLTVPEGATLKMTVPAALIPRCPRCGRPMSMNLRADDTFVEDAGWHAAARRYADFARAHDRGRVLYLEIGVGWNTPGIIKYNFWNSANDNPDATYACLNHDDARIPRELEGRSIAIEGDSAEVIAALASDARNA